MALILLILIVGFSLIIFYLSEMRKKKEVERKKREAIRHEASEKIMRPERKLHEEEKKRWEDEYWKRQKDRKD